MRITIEIDGPVTGPAVQVGGGPGSSGADTPLPDGAAAPGATAAAGIDAGAAPGAEGAAGSDPGSSPSTGRASVGAPLSAGPAPQFTA